MAMSFSSEPDVISIDLSQDFALYSSRVNILPTIFESPGGLQSPIQKSKSRLFEWKKEEKVNKKLHDRLQDIIDGDKDTLKEKKYWKSLKESNNRHVECSNMKQVHKEIPKKKVDLKAQLSRLYFREFELKSKRIEISDSVKRQREEEALAACTFHPQITHYESSKKGNNSLRLKSSDVTKDSLRLLYLSSIRSNCTEEEQKEWEIRVSELVKEGKDLMEVLKLLLSGEVSGLSVYDRSIICKARMEWANVIKLQDEKKKELIDCTFHPKLSSSNKEHDKSSYSKPTLSSKIKAEPDPISPNHPNDVEYYDEKVNSSKHAPISKVKADSGLKLDCCEKKANQLEIQEEKSSPSVFFKSKSVDVIEINLKDSPTSKLSNSSLKVKTI